MSYTDYDGTIYRTLSDEPQHLTPLPIYAAVPTGWLCPRCGTAHSPSTATCLLCQPKPRSSAGANADAYSL